MNTSSTCHRLLERMAERHLPADLKQHLLSCAACQQAKATYQALDAVAPEPLSSSAEAHIRAQVHRELSVRPRARPWWVEAALVAAVNVATAAGGIALMSGFSLPAGARAGTLMAVSGLLVFLMVSGSVAAFAPRPGLLRSAVVASALGAAVAVGLTGAGFELPAGGLMPGMRCLMAELMISLLPALVALGLLTRMAYEPTRALLVGLSCGAVGLLTLHFHCEVGSASHLILFHLAPWVGIGLGAWWARRRLRTRNFTP